MNKSKNKILSFIIAFSMLLSFLPFQVFGTESGYVELSFEAGPIEIYPTYYTQNGNQVEHTGGYILHGETYQEGHLKISSSNEEEVTYNIKLQDCGIYTEGNYNEAILIDKPNITVNFTVEGYAGFFSVGDYALKTNGAKVNFEISQKSSIEFLTLLSSGKAIDSISNITINEDTIIKKGLYLDEEGTLEDGTSNNGLGIYFSCNHEMDNHQCTKCDYDIHEYTIVGDSLSQYEHQLKCSCGAVSEEGHRLENESDEKYHTTLCSNCSYRDPEAHSFEVEKVEDCNGTVTFDKNICSVCEYIKRDNMTMPENTLYVSLTDMELDGFNGAKLEVIINGEPQEITFDEGYSYGEIIDYNPEDGIIFKWIKGNYDWECEVNIYNKEGLVYSKKNFDEVKDNEVIYAINHADYSPIEEALASVPKDLSLYTLETIIKLGEVVDSINYDLGIKDQDKVNRKAEEIITAINNLVKDTSTAGKIDLSKGNLTITDKGYTLGETKVDYTGEYFIFSSEDSKGNTISVLSGKHNITIYNLNIIDDPADELIEGKSAFDIEAGEVNLTVIGENTFTNIIGKDSGWDLAAFHVGKDAKLTITEQSTGILNATSCEEGAGIGGGYFGSAGNIEINGGTINAKSNGSAAGIGGGCYGSIGNIEINGGIINAESRGSGAGIGTGKSGKNGKIIINGGNIYAYSHNYGAGIGGGDYSNAEEITINGGYIVVESGDSVAIGGGDEGKAGKITINNGTINILAYDTYIIGSGPNASEEDSTVSDDNFIHINGGNIVSDNPNALSFTATNSNGEEVKPVELEVSEELANKIVTVTFEGSDESYTVLPVGRKVIVYVKKGVNTENPTIIEKKADYSKLDELIAKIPSDLSIYTDESVAKLNEVLERIESDLDRDLNVKDQAIVDNYVIELTEGINGLVLKEVVDPSGPVTSGDESPIFILIVVMAIAGFGLFIMRNKPKKHKNESK